MLTPINLSFKHKKDAALSEENKGSVFISYSRKDREFAEKLVERLRAKGFETLRDLDDILPTESWRERLEDLIHQADSIVFLLSPASAKSEICVWEVELANSLNKKIAPIVIEDVEGAQIPDMLSRLNYIFATGRDRFENAVDTLSDALSQDIDWLREHSRLLGIARRWENASKTDGLLSATEIGEAEAWVASRPSGAPPVAGLVQTFIETSMEQQRLQADYDKFKLMALSETVEPLLNAEIAKLETKIEERKRTTKFRNDTTINEMGVEVEALRNFFGANGRWHPLPATFEKTAGAEADYAEIYKFDCCQKYVARMDRKQPNQFRADGCQEEPGGNVRADASGSDGRLIAPDLQNTPAKATLASTIDLSDNLRRALLRIPSNGSAVTGLGDNADDPDDNELARRGLATIACDQAGCGISLTGKGRLLQSQLLAVEDGEKSGNDNSEDDKAETENSAGGDDLETAQSKDNSPTELVNEQEPNADRIALSNGIGLSSILIGILMFVVTELIILSLGFLAFGAVMLVVVFIKKQRERHTSTSATLEQSAQLRRGTIEGDDYPASALKAGIEGKVVVAVNIDVNGRPVEVSVLKSSNNEALDNATCRVVQRRFRYHPALNSLGDPVFSVEKQTVLWQLP